MTMTDDVWGPTHGIDEPCLTADKKPISVGMLVVDYDRRDAVVTKEPWTIREPYDPVCWSQAGHHGHWWDTNTGTFDGSRMQSR